MNIKQKLYKHCQEFLNSKLKSIEKTIQSNKDALNSETKSSAGDKHETGRAMLQLEMEKAGQQLIIVTEMKEQLARVNCDTSSKKVRLGSVIKTNTATYFLAISMGQIKIDGTLYFVISTDSPIGKLMLGKEVNDVVSFRENDIKITQVI